MDQPVPASVLLSALKDIATGQVLVTLAMWVTMLPLMTYPKSSVYSGKINLKRRSIRHTH